MGTLSKSERGNFLSDGPELCCTFSMALAVSPLVCSNLACREQSLVNGFQQHRDRPYFLYGKGKSDSILAVVEKARVLIEEVLCHISHSSA